MKKRQLFGFVITTVFIFVFIFVTMECHACTGILMKTQDGHYIFGRTMEFDAEFMPHDIIAVPRGYGFTGQTPSGKPGMAWKTKYAFVGFNPAGQIIVDDGLNEKGLACGALFFLGCAKFEDVNETDFSSTISCVELAPWILSTCASVAEVREQLPRIKVCGVLEPVLGFIPPIHCMVADKTGDAIIIEYIEGKLRIHNNAVNAIANAPDYTWHTTNVRNFIGLKPESNPPITINGEKYSQFAQGSGAFGLPGDFTSPSRFIRAMFFANAATPGKDADEGISIAFRVLNQFDIPKGSNLGVEPGNLKVNEATQWTSAADLTNGRYFYHTYNDRSIRMIDLKKVNVNARDIMTIKAVQKPGEIKDVSGQFK